MSVRTPHRLAAIAAPVLVAGLVLGACGGSGDDSAETQPTITLDTETTNYVTVAPTPTAAPVDPTATTLPEVTAASGYTIQAGDVPVNVASRFNVSVEDIANLNGWGACSATSCPEWPFPGEEIQIPGGVPVSNAPATESTDTAETETPVVDTGETGEAIPDPGTNCDAGSHTVVAGDIPLRLVDLYDVSLDALNAANANNPAYSRFIPGDQIVIPAKDDC